ncbi:Hypothetical_protein [Hexamita inflata]|uniref:Hypothetical_protein n=1 Tax=Hexamita inflata TaxID=28002 RepID=A0AA86TGX9_9EUKA|nr:Hypothetical protein HINF_LOCUS4531 [Hexamita inflata]
MFQIYITHDYLDKKLNILLLRRSENQRAVTCTLFRNKWQLIFQTQYMKYQLLIQSSFHIFKEIKMMMYVADRKIPWFRALTKLILHQQRESFLIVNPYFSGISFCHLFFDQNLMQVSFLVTILRQAENNCQKIVRKKANKLEQQ